MKGMMRVGDIAVGVDYHPTPPYVFPWFGTPVVGAPSIVVEGTPAVRVGDMYRTTCPICGVGTALTGRPDVPLQGSAEHRKGDVVQTPGGFGVGLIGSPSVKG